MKLSREQMVRYGDKDFDLSYINWGFHDESSQIKDAESLVPIFGETRDKILDVACGIGRYHKVWIDKGHSVTGIDLSETFIKLCNDRNNFQRANYMVCDLYSLPFAQDFDVVTWIDPAYVCGIFIKNIYRSLKPNGIFVFDSRNPNYPKYRDLRRNKGKVWTLNDGVYRLIRDEYNYATQKNEYEEIRIDTNNDEIKIRHIEGEDVSLQALKEIMHAAGFCNLREINRNGTTFDPNDESVQRFWLIAERS